MSLIFIWGQVSIMTLEYWTQTGEVVLKGKTERSPIRVWLGGLQGPPGPPGLKTVRCTQGRTLSCFSTSLTETCMDLEEVMSFFSHKSLLFQFPNLFTSRWALVSAVYFLLLCVPVDLQVFKHAFQMNKIGRIQSWKESWYTAKSDYLPNRTLATIHVKHIMIL